MPTLVPLDTGAVPGDNWIEDVCFGLYAIVAVLSVQTFVSTGLPMPGSLSVAAGIRMRRKLAVGMLLASLARCLALAVRVMELQGSDVPILRSMHGAELRWAEDMILLLPDALFLSSFAIVLLFWAQLHYTTTMVVVPLLDCLFLAVNASFFLLLAGVAVCTFFLHAYDHLRSYVICIIGIMNLVVAFAFVYYSATVMSDLSETARKRLPERRHFPRMLSLSVVLPVGLVLRGVCYLVWDLPLGSPTLLSDLLLCMLSEWLPAVVSLVVLGPLSPGGAAAQSIDGGESTDSEQGTPFLQDDPSTAWQKGDPNGEKGFSWKQLYPQPN